MAFGQIDPARLEGDALRRWYLRSPEDIEDERLRRADQSYDAFYGGLQYIRQSASPTPNRPRRASGFGSTAGSVLWSGGNSLSEAGRGAAT